MLKAVILIGGPQKGTIDETRERTKGVLMKPHTGTRFRPLSLDIPKPLFPVAGLPIIQHHIEACARVPQIAEILIIGYYPAAQMEQFVSEMQLLYDDVVIRWVDMYTNTYTRTYIMCSICR